MTSPTFAAIAFSGSLRNGSSNTALVRLAQRIAPPELTIEIIDWVDQLPWMNPDLATVVEEPQVRLSLIGDRIDADGNTDDPLIIDAVAAKLRALVDALTLRAATPGA